MLTVRTHHVLRAKFLLNNVDGGNIVSPNKFFNSRNGVNKLLYNRTHKVPKQINYCSRDAVFFCYGFQCLAHRTVRMRTVVICICAKIYLANDTEHREGKISGKMKNKNHQMDTENEK